MNRVEPVFGHHLFPHLQRVGVRKTSRFSLGAISIAFLLMIFSPAVFANENNEYEDALGKTEQEYIAFVDAAEQTQKKLKNAEKMLKDAQRAFKKAPRSKRKAAREQLKKINKLLKPLRKQSKAFGKFVKFAGKGKSVFEAAKQLTSFKKSVDNLTSGDLSTQMKEIGKALENFGGNVPFVGSILEGYGKATQELIGATDRLSKKIVANRNQDIISGTGAHKNTKGQKVEDLFGKDFVDKGQIVQTKNYIYRRDSRRSDFVLIWDGNTFTKFDGKVDAEKIYSEHMLIRKYCPPSKMIHYGNHYQKYKDRNSDGKQIYKFLRKFLRSEKYYDAYHSMPWRGRALAEQKNLKMFMAKYAHDPAFNAYMRNVWLPQFKKKILEAGFKEKKFVKLKIGIPEKEVVVKEEEVKNICELTDDKKEKLLARMSKASPSEIASLFKKVLPEKDSARLRNCICRANAGASSSVSVFYEPKPVGGSPSCKDPAGGPCVCSGFGCWRTPFKPDIKALESCGVSTKLVDALCGDKPKKGGKK